MQTELLRFHWAYFIKQTRNGPEPLKKRNFKRIDFKDDNIIFNF